MITREDAARLQDELLEVLEEDARNVERITARLDSITEESGIEAHAALLLILTHLPVEEDEARGHWKAILSHRETLSRALGRDTGVRVAVLDYFVNVNRRLVEPTLIDLKMAEMLHPDRSTDPLTGLASDRKFRAAVQAELRRARRYRQQAAVVVVDLDEFAAVNERVGALVGDRLLREVGILLKNNVRDIDVVARLGEDEMAVLLPETGRNEALSVAERFRLEIESYFSTRDSRGKPVNLTISAGVACYPDDAATPEAVLERAAQALYQAKASGRNAVELFGSERRRYLRFDLDPTLFEVEVLAPVDRGPGRLRNYSFNGVLFSTPEPLEVGETIEIRLLPGVGEAEGERPRLRGRVVRLEEMTPRAGDEAGKDAADESYEVGVALDEDAETRDVLDLLELARRGSPGWTP